MAATNLQHKRRNKILGGLESKNGYETWYLFSRSLSSLLDFWNTRTPKNVDSYNGIKKKNVSLKVISITLLTSISIYLNEDVYNIIFLYFIGVYEISRL